MHPHRNGWQNRAMSPPRSVLIGILVIPWLATALVATGWIGLPEDHVFSGFCQGDELVYTAKSLEIIEGGNRFTYGNPFSEDPDTPAVYVSLIFTAIGWIWRWTGIEPVWILWGGRIVGGSIALALAWRLIRLCVGENPSAARWCFYWVALGSGLGWIFTSTHGAMLELHRSFDPIFAGGGGEGLQLFGWLADRVRPTVPKHYSPGIFTTIVHSYAAIYQAFFIATCLALAERRRTAAVILFTLPYWAHPWAGSMLLCLGGTFLAIELALERDRADLVAGVLFALIGSVWLYYYTAFLNSIPEARLHAEQVRNPPYAWRTPTTYLPQYIGVWGTAILAPIVLLPMRGTWRRVLRSRAERLVVIWVLICFIILNNFRFLDSPLQPDQLGGRWLWLPLVILATMSLIRFRPTPSRRALALMVLVSLPESARLSYDYFVRGVRHSRVLVRPTSMTAVVQAVSELPGRRFVFADDPDIANVIVAHTPHRAYYSHWNETPHLIERQELLAHFAKAPSVSIPDSLGAELWVLSTESASRVSPNIAELGTVLHRSNDYIVLERRPGP